VTLAAIVKRLDAMSEADLVALVSKGGLSESLATALELPSAARVELSLPSSSGNSGVSTEGWQRLSLLPGLELHVAASVSSLVQGLVRQIYADDRG